MAFPYMSVKAPLRSFLLLIAMFSLTWSVNSLVGAIASCREVSDDDCGSSTTDNEPGEVQGASVSFWSTPPMESTTPSSIADDSDTLTEKSSTTSRSDSITFQLDNPTNEPDLSTDDSGSQPLSGGTTSNSKESVSLTTEESSDTTPSETTTVSMKASRVVYGPLACCHPVRNFPFADDLRKDACKVMTTDGLGKKDPTDFEHVEVKQVYDNLVESVEKLRRSAEDTLNNDVLDVCKEVEWYPLAKIPTQRDLQALATAEILHLYHSSLLNYTAYLHHVLYQLQNYDRTCNRGEIDVSARKLAFDIKKVTCFLRLYILAVHDEYDDESFEKSSKEVLNVSLCNECVCSRRAVYDCQVVSSLNTILTQFGTFMKKIDPLEAKTRLNQRITLQPDSQTNEPTLSTDVSSVTQPIRDSTTSDSIQSITLSKIESTTTPASDPSISRLQPIEAATVSMQVTCTQGCCFPAQHFKFADKLRDDPCNVVKPGGLGKKDTDDFEPVSVKQVYYAIQESIEILRRTADNTLDNDLLNDCRLFNFGAVGTIPTQRDLQILGTAEILYMYYSSLVNHTAYLHYMSYQLQIHDRTCSKGAIRASAHRLAFDIRKVTCFLRLYLLAVFDEYDDESFEKPSKEALNVSLCDEMYCSRRAIYDCMVVSSVNTILLQLAAFIEKIDPIEATKILEPGVHKRFKRMLNHPDW